MLDAVEQKLTGLVPEEQKRFFAIKLLEKDDKIAQQMASVPDVSQEIQQLETAMDDDTESIITNERYEYIASVISQCYTKNKKSQMTVSDKIDRVVTNRWLALPIFAVIMVIVYYISVTTVGTWATDWANDGVFGEGWYLFGIGRDEYDAAVELAATTAAAEPDPADYGIWVPGVPVLVGNLLTALNCGPIVEGVVLDGIVAGVGAVLGFVPQILVLFIFLAFLESCGYMARIAFIMDRVFRKFGLSVNPSFPCSLAAAAACRELWHPAPLRMTGTGR